MTHSTTGNEPITQPNPFDLDIRLGAPDEATMPRADTGTDITLFDSTCHATCGGFEEVKAWHDR